MVWAVVEFLESEEVEAVPFNWIQVMDRKTFCWWPLQKAQKMKDLIMKEVDICGLPGSRKYEVRILGNNYESLTLARQKCRKAEDESELDSECGPRKRHIKTLYSPPVTPRKSPRKRYSTVAPSQSPISDLELDLPPTPNLDLFSHSSSTDDNPRLLPATRPLSTSSKRSLYSITSGSKSQTPNIKHTGAKNTNLQTTTTTTPRPGPSSSKTVLSGGNPRYDYRIFDEEWKTNVEQALSYIKLKVDDIYDTLLASTVGRRNADDITDEEFRQPEAHVVTIDKPLSSQEELEELEKTLLEKHAYNYLVRDMSRLGGNTVKEVTKRLLRRLLSDELAQLYSFHGFKKKKTFSSLKLNNIVFDTVRKNTVTANASDADIEGVIKDWLRQAKFRAISKNKKLEAVLDDLAQAPQDI